MIMNRQKFQSNTGNLLTNTNHSKKSSISQNRFGNGVQGKGQEPGAVFLHSNQQSRKGSDNNDNSALEFLNQNFNEKLIQFDHLKDKKSGVDILDHYDLKFDIFAGPPSNTSSQINDIFKQPPPVNNQSKYPNSNNQLVTYNSQSPDYLLSLNQKAQN